MQFVKYDYFHFTWAVPQISQSAHTVSQEGNSTVITLKLKLCIGKFSEWTLTA